jgi:hypothetical protein
LIASNESGKRLASHERAARDAADAVRNLRAAYDALQVERQSVEEAHRSLLALDPSYPDVLPEEKEYVDAWRELAPCIEDELNMRLESEIVDAAAKSANGYEIERLPEHLQVLARERRRELIRNRTRQEQ